MMRITIKNIIFLLFFNLIFLGCEDVIEVDVPTTEPKLVIEASLNWFKGTNGNNQEIKLTLTAPYFNDGVLPATGATVTVTNGNNTTFNFGEVDNTGLYRTPNFIPEIGQSYSLSIIYDGETYVANTTMQSVSTITRVEQKDNGGFTEDETELKAYYNDPADEENFYFFEFINSEKAQVSLEVYNDEFTNGNEIFGFYSDEDLESGDDMIIRMYGVSEQFYEFMFILLQQNNDENGDPFEVQPATIRGNCINTTNPDNFPLGYFRASEAHQFDYTVE